MKNEKGTIVLAGGVIGLIAAILVFFGNPANMGFCIANTAADHFYHILFIFK